MATANLNTVPFGEFFIDHDDGIDNSLTIYVGEDYQVPVTPEELHMLVAARVQQDLERNNLSYPPDAEQMLQLGTDFYDTYLNDTTENKVEIIDRYMAALIEALELKHGDDFRFAPDVVHELLDSVHELEVDKQLVEVK